MCYNDFFCFVLVCMGVCACVSFGYFLQIVAVDWNMKRRVIISNIRIMLLRGWRWKIRKTNEIWKTNENSWMRNNKVYELRDNHEILRVI